MYRLRLNLLLLSGLIAFLLSNGVSVTAQDFTSDLEAYYTFDEGSGSVAADSSGNNNTGTVSGATWSSSGQVDGCLEFDGSYDFVSVTNSASLQITGQITIAAWVRVDNVSSYHCIVGHGTTSSAVQNTYLYAWNGDWLGGSHSSGNDEYANSNVNSGDIGSWVHVAAVYNGSQWRLFRNGQYVTHNDTSQGAQNVSSSRWSIGSPSSQDSRFFDGMLDEVRIYSRGLSDADILALYNSTMFSNAMPIYVSTSGGATFGGLTVEDEDVAFFDPNTTTATRIFEGDVVYASDEETDAYHLLSSGNLLFSTGDSATIGTLSFNDEDVVEVDPNTGTATLFFDGSAVFSGDEDLDAFCVLGNGNYVLSTSGGATIGSLSFNDEDLVEYDPNSGTATMFLDGSTVISDDSGNGLDINGVHVDSNGLIYLSMTENSTIGGLSFGDDDVVQYDPNSGTATLVFPGGSLFSSSSEDVDAIGMPVAIQGTLEANWKLAELTGTTAVDASDAELDGSYSGGVTLNSNGPYPDEGAVAAQFDGTDDYVDLPDMHYDYSEGFSVSVWAMPSALNYWARFVELGNGSEDSNIIFGRKQNSDTLAIHLYDGSLGAGLQALEVSGQVELGKWQHFVATIDSSGVAKLYKNGQLVGTGSIGIPDNVNRTENYIGRSSWSIDNYFQGSMFDVRLWNREISATEVADLYGLVGHWKMDEGIGSTIADSTGYDNDATLSGATWTSDCVGRYALEFDGVGGTAATGATFDPPEKGAVALWFRSNGPPTARQRPWGVGADFEMWQDTDGLVSFDVSTDGLQGGFITTDPLYTDGQWYHLVGVYDSADESYSIYIDGKLHKTGISTWDIVKQSANTLTFGTRTGSTEYFEGAIRDFRIYNRPLSNEEISELSGLIAHWQFDELSGSVADDEGVGANDATFVSSPTLGVNGPYPAATGTAVELNGNSQYITSGQSLLNNLSEFTIMGWIRPDDTDPDESFFGQNGLIELGIDSASNQIDLWTATGGSVSATVQLPYGKWSHLTATGSGTELKIYVNGREVASGGSSTSTYGSNSYAFKIGEGVLDASGDYFDGRVDDVRIYGRLLCPDEVNAAYKGGRPTGVRILQWVETR